VGSAAKCESVTEEDARLSRRHRMLGNEPTPWFHLGLGKEIE
jgi:hypothetical protein